MALLNSTNAGLDTIYTKCQGALPALELLVQIALKVLGLLFAVGLLDALASLAVVSVSLVVGCAYRRLRRRRAARKSRICRCFRGSRETRRKRFDDHDDHDDHDDADDAGCGADEEEGYIIKIDSEKRITIGEASFYM